MPTRRPSPRRRPLRKPPRRYDPAVARPPRLSRRGLLRTVGTTTALAACKPPKAHEAAPPEDVEVLGPEPIPVTFLLDGRRVRAKVPVQRTLQVCLQEDLGCTAPKAPCDRGACGGCLVRLDGVAVPSCTMLAADADGRCVDTAAHPDPPPLLAALRRAFVAHDAAQCGYCTAGMITAAWDLLDRAPEPAALDEAAVRRAMAGNLCRCGTHRAVVRAILDVAGRKEAW